MTRPVVPPARPPAGMARIERDHPVRSALRLYAGQRRRIALAALAFTAKHSPVWVMPLLTANVIDAVVQRSPTRVLVVNAVAMVALVVLNLPMTWAYARWFSLAVRSVEADCRMGLCQRLQELSIGYHRRTSAGVLQAKVIRDVENIVETSRQVFDSGMAAVTTLLGALVLTAIRVPQFLPVFLLVVPAAALVVRAMRRRMTHRNQLFRREIEQLSARVSEMTHLIPVTRAHATELDELARIDSSLGRVRTQGTQLDVLNGGFNALAWMLFQLLSVGCLVTAAAMARAGTFDLTVGDVVLLSTYFLTLTGAVTMLLNVAPVATRGLESVRSMAEVLAEPDLELNAGKRRVTRVEGAFRFEHVTLTYPDAPTPALSDIDLVVEPGETLALVGPSGSGKSSLLNLAIGFLHPTQGRLLLDGEDLQDLDLRDYRRRLAVVPQESLLFEGSVRDNVTYGQPHLDDRALQSALEDANAWDFVQELGGVDAPVGERGGRLSGGQKQRLAIARALIRDPRVLVLDEPTAALDPRSEAMVQEALARLVRGRTTFVVAHRLSTIRGADRIAVLQNGHLVEVGSHDELMARGGAYVELSTLAAG